MGGVSCNEQRSRGRRRVTRRSCGVVGESAVAAHAPAASEVCALLKRRAAGVGGGTAAASAVVGALRRRLLVRRWLLVGSRIARADRDSGRLMEEPAALAHAAATQEVVANLGGGGRARVMHVSAVIPHAAATLKVGAQLDAGTFDRPGSGIVRGAAAIRCSAIGGRACISRAGATASRGILVSISSATGTTSGVLVVACVTTSGRSTVSARCCAVAARAATVC